MFSQWPPVLPTWSNFVKFDFQKKHLDPAENSALHSGSSIKYAHRGWLCIAQGVVIHKIPTQLRTSENSWEHRKTSKIIWYYPENNWGHPIDSLVQFEEDFNSRTEMWWSGPVDGYLRPDQFLDHLTVIKILVWRTFQPHYVAESFVSFVENWRE